jgi:hypothetical protein
VARILDYRMNRRSLLGAAAGMGIGALLLKGTGGETCAATLAEDAVFPIKHNMWVWRFDVDGDHKEVLERVRNSGMGVLLKCFEGPDWMAKHDSSPTSVRGPAQVRWFAEFFESAGVPFHAWGVVKGQDVVAEAQIASEVLNSGARSMTFDLEPAENQHYWHGTPESALHFGYEIRSRQPQAQLAVAPDARPWQIDAVPTAEFATFVNAIMPQSYWQTFNSPTNHRYMRERGYEIGPEGMTPELILNATAHKLAQFGLPIRPIGQGTAGAWEWMRFIDHAYKLGMDCVSVWRYGTANSEIWEPLGRMQPPQDAPQVAAPAAETPPPAQEAAAPSATEAPTSSEGAVVAPARAAASDSSFGFNTTTASKPLASTGPQTSDPCATR